MDLVNYLPLDFGQHSPKELAGYLKQSNLSPFCQNWLLSQQEVFDQANDNWSYVYSSEGLGLINLKRAKHRPITIGSKDSKNNLSELMSKICAGKKQVQLMDATAGLLNDTHSLLRLGYPLMSFEANPLLALLIMTNSILTTNLKQFQSKWDFKPISFDKHQFSKIEGSFKVILYDPMFMQSLHKSLPSLEMQILMDLELQFPNISITEEEFNKWRCFAQVTVVKRPDKAPYLLGIKPKYSLNSKLLRWDIY